MAMPRRPAAGRGAADRKRGDATMSQHAVFTACAVCLLLVLALSVFTGEAAAQGDKDLATKQGLDSLATKQFDKNKLPGKLEMGLAVGSIFVMIAVVKWL
jgi:hypothetical protein